MMYASSQKVLRGMGAHRRGMGDSDISSSISKISNPVSAVTGIISGIASLFGGKTGVQNPSGPVAFARWAKEGHFDWVASVALNMSGPDWSKDPNDTGSPWKTGYSPADAQSATAVLTSYHLTPAQAVAMSAGSPASAAALAPAGTTVTQSGLNLTTAGLTSLASNPTLLIALAAGAYFLSKRGRR